MALLPHKGRSTPQWRSPIWSTTSDEDDVVLCDVAQVLVMEAELDVVEAV